MDSATFKSWSGSEDAFFDELYEPCAMTKRSDFTERVYRDLPVAGAVDHAYDEVFLDEPVYRSLSFAPPPLEFRDPNRIQDLASAYRDFAPTSLKSGRQPEMREDTFREQLVFGLQDLDLKKDTVRPPALPSFSFFQLSKTHFRSRHHPSLLMSKISKYLKEHCKQCDLKIKESAFVIKGFVSPKDRCLLKLKVSLFSLDNDMYIVELQRLQGDIVEFNALYRQILGTLLLSGIAEKTSDLQMNPIELLTPLELPEPILCEA